MGQFQLLRSRLCWKVVGAVFVGIFLIEAFIAIPTYRDRERQLLLRLESDAKTMVTSLNRLAPADTAPLGFATLAQTIMPGTGLLGGAIYDPAGNLLHTFGETPSLDPVDDADGGWPPQRPRARNEARDRDGHELTWRLAGERGPVYVVVRLDASQVKDKLAGFLWRTLFNVAMVAIFVTIVAMAMVGRLVLSPVLQIRKAILEDDADAADPSLQKLNNEIGDVAAAVESYMEVSRESQRHKAEQNELLEEMVRERTEELRTAKEHAELVNRGKTEFLANMSHELRTPLNAIIGFSDIMKKEMFGPIGNPGYREYANDINESGDHLLKLINDILDLSKIEAGKYELLEEYLHVDEIISSTLRLLAVRASESSVETRVELPEELPLLYADERGLKQIFINLLSNAVKFTPAGGRVTVGAEIGDAQDLIITVADTGIGMSKEDLPKALAAFEQVDSSLARKYEGTGLGLPLAKSLTELHGGTLEISSEPGVGTTVTVSMPTERVFEADHVHPRRAAEAT